MNYEYLLNEYKSLWQNRLLATDENSSEEILKLVIKRDLLDENTHPRVRKTIYEKFFSAIKRINESALQAKDKDMLITIHVKMLEQLRSSK